MITWKRASAEFRHGVHPPEYKHLTEKRPLRRLPFPDEVVIPLRQHTGRPARPIVKRGDRVVRGDKIAEAQGYISVPMHASVSGRVADVCQWPHPDGSTALAVRIQADRYSPQVPRIRRIPDWRTLSPREIAAVVQNAGLVGLGGAAFPTHVKLIPPEGRKAEVILVNGAECEPFLTTDHRTMLEYPERVYLGLRIMMHALGVQRAVIGVEENKSDAIQVLKAGKPADLDVTVQPLKVKYPQGAEKMLIRTVMGVEVPSGELPISVGAVVQNVGSVATIGEIFETGMPLVERIVTVTGHGIRKPANLIVPIGTKLEFLLDSCGGLTDDAAEVIFGGPMMGAAQADVSVPVLKGTTGVVVLTKNEVTAADSYPCIGCGRCLEACPTFLNPSLMASFARVARYEDMEEARLADCILCGSCAYVCPSNIPLAQLFLVSKAALQKRKVQAA